MNESTPSKAAASAAASPIKPLGEVITINEGLIKDHLNQVVVTTVEETLNALLDAEADQLCGAKRYEHSEARVDTRAGHYERQLHTKAGEVTLKVPKLRSLPFESAIIERYKRRPSPTQRIALLPGLDHLGLGGCSRRSYRHFGRLPLRKSRIYEAPEATLTFNSAIQTLKNIARGYRNFANFRVAVLFHHGKLDLAPR